MSHSGIPQIFIYWPIWLFIPILLIQWIVVICYTHVVKPYKVFQLLLLSNFLVSLIWFPIQWGMLEIMNFFGYDFNGFFERIGSRFRHVYLAPIIFATIYGIISFGITAWIFKWSLKNNFAKAEDDGLFTMIFLAIGASIFIFWFVVDATLRYTK